MGGKSSAARERQLQHGCGAWTASPCSVNVDLLTSPHATSSRDKGDGAVAGGAGELRELVARGAPGGVADPDSPASMSQGHRWVRRDAHAALGGWS